LLHRFLAVGIVVEVVVGLLLIVPAPSIFWLRLFFLLGCVFFLIGMQILFPFLLLPRFRLMCLH
jgi:hypothetical protein